MQRKSAFSRRLPDLVTEELVYVLSKKGASFEFKQLFDVVHERLKKRNAASGGEEMLRLRAYEKLQHLVSLANAIVPEEPIPPAAIAVPAVPVKKAPPVAKKAPAKAPVKKVPAKPVAKKVVKVVAKKKPSAKPVARKVASKSVKKASK